MTAHLRLFPHDDESGAPSPIQEPTVRLRLGDLLPLLSIAHKKGYVWLQDFLDDEVLITSDLHDILRAFRSHLRPTA
jgi:hypothetical protein